MFTFLELEANLKTQLQVVAESIKVHGKDADQREELRGALKEAEAERDAKFDARKKVESDLDTMAASRDTTITSLQKLREQTFDRMNQSASISVETMFDLLKSNNPDLNTLVVLGA